MSEVRLGFSIGQCGYGDPVLQSLLRQADAEFVARYPELRGQRRGAILPTITFLILRSHSRAVGCCGLQSGGPDAWARPYEMKRLFVIPEARGTGAADLLMTQAHRVAGMHGADSVCFETGYRQPEAIRVVRRHGYQRIPPYPPYLDDPFALCYLKTMNNSGGGQ